MSKRENVMNNLQQWFSTSGILFFFLPWYFHKLHLTLSQSSYFCIAKKSLKKYRNIKIKFDLSLHTFLSRWKKKRKGIMAREFVVAESLMKSRWSIQSRLNPNSRQSRDKQTLLTYMYTSSIRVCVTERGRATVRRNWWKFFHDTTLSAPFRRR